MFENLADKYCNETLHYLYIHKYFIIFYDFLFFLKCIFWYSMYNDHVLWIIYKWSDIPYHDFFWILANNNIIIV